MMKRTAMMLAAAAIATITTAHTATAQSYPAQEMSIGQARRAILIGSKYAGAAREYSKVFHAYSYYALRTDSIRIAHDALDFDAIDRKGEALHFRIALRELVRLSTRCSVSACWLVDGSGKRVEWQSNNSPNAYGLDFGVSIPKRCGDAQNTEECLQAADQFAAALNRLHTFALGPELAEENFSHQATAWRLLSTKPPLQDGVRVRRLMAEDAIRNQKPEDALKCYIQGLDIYSLWPEGWFNAAVIAGQLGYYADAAAHMQNYLEPVPDAADAQSARDQIAMWRFKAGQSQPLQGK